MYTYNKLDMILTIRMNNLLLKYPFIIAILFTILNACYLKLDKSLYTLVMISNFAIHIIMHKHYQNKYSKLVDLKKGRF